MTRASCMPKHHLISRRTRPAGDGPHCLTLPSEPTKKLAVFEPSNQPNSKSQLRSSKSQWHSMPNTLLSDPTINLPSNRPNSKSQLHSMPNRACHGHSSPARSPCHRLGSADILYIYTHNNCQKFEDIAHVFTLYSCITLHPTCRCISCIVT